MPSSSDQTSLKLATLEGRTKEAAYYLIYILRYFGLPGIITEARRTAARQADLYAQGRTRPGPIVTNTLQSNHITGRAFDIDMSGFNAVDVPLNVWQFSGEVGEYLGLRWGGRWTIRDYRHFETPS